MRGVGHLQEPGCQHITEEGQKSHRQENLPSRKTPVRDDGSWYVHPRDRPPGRSFLFWVTSLTRVFDCFKAHGLEQKQPSPSHTYLFLDLNFLPIVHI